MFLRYSLDCMAQAGLQLMLFLPQAPREWLYRCHHKSVLGEKFKHAKALRGVHELQDTLCWNRRLPPLALFTLRAAQWSLC